MINRSAFFLGIVVTMLSMFNLPYSKLTCHPVGTLICLNDIAFASTSLSPDSAVQFMFIPSRAGAIISLHDLLDGEVFFPPASILIALM